MQSTYSYANASIARQAFSNLWTAIIWHPLPNCTFSSIPNQEKKWPYFVSKLWVLDTLHVNQCQIYFPLLYSRLSLCLSLLCDPIFFSLPYNFNSLSVLLLCLAYSLISPLFLVCKFYFCNCACTSVTDSMDMLKKEISAAEAMQNVLKCP